MPGPLGNPPATTTPAAFKTWAQTAADMANDHEDRIDDLEAGSSAVDDTAYDATSWNGVTTTAPSKNAVRDLIEAILDGITFSGDVVVPDEAYGVGWNGSLEVPTKNAVYDKIETIGGGGGGTLEEGSLYAGIDSRVHYESEFGADEGYDEEFDGANIADDTLPTSWVDLSLEAAAVYRQAFGAGRIDWGGGGDASNIQAIGRTLPATTTFDAMCHLKMAHNDDVTYLGGMILHNSANGDYIWFGLHQPATPAVPQLYVVHYTDADTSSTTLAGPITVWPSQGPDGYFWIIKQSDTDYDFMFSPDGACFFTVASNLTINTTLGADPTHIGFGLNTSGAGHVACEWLRVRNVT